MNLSEPFVRRPVATTLMTIGNALAGLTAYVHGEALPVMRATKAAGKVGVFWNRLDPGRVPELVPATKASPNAVAMPLPVLVVLPPR